MKFNSIARGVVLAIFASQLQAQIWMQEPRLLWVLEDQDRGAFDSFWSWQMLRYEQNWHQMREAQMQAQAALISSYAELESTRAQTAVEDARVKHLSSLIAKLESQKKSLEQRMAQLHAQSVLIRNQVRMLNQASAGTWNTEASGILRRFAEQVSAQALVNIRVNETVLSHEIETRRKFFKTQRGGRVVYQANLPSELKFEGGNVGEYLEFLDRSGHKMGPRGQAAISELIDVVSVAMEEKLFHMDQSLSLLSQEDEAIIESIRKTLDQF